jgi:hypothetical protein
MGGSRAATRGAQGPAAAALPLGAVTAVPHSPGAAAAFSAGRHSRQHSARSYATETAADKFELFSPEAGLTHIEGCAIHNFAGSQCTPLHYTTRTA